MYFGPLCDCVACQLKGYIWCIILNSIVCGRVYAYMHASWVPLLHIRKLYAVCSDLSRECVCASVLVKHLCVCVRACVLPGGKALMRCVPESKQLCTEPGTEFLNDWRPDIEPTWGGHQWNIHVTWLKAWWQRGKVLEEALRGGSVWVKKKVNIFKTLLKCW